MARAREASLAARIGSLAQGAALAALLAGCAPEGFPDDALFADAPDLPAQRLEPIDPVLADPADDARTGPARAELSDRGADLRARAEALRTRAD